MNIKPEPNALFYGACLDIIASFLENIFCNAVRNKRLPQKMYNPENPGSDNKHRI